MKKIIAAIALTTIISCGPTAVTTSGPKPIYEILTQQSQGGANIQFYEILSESNEIKMLLGDPNLKDKITSNDTSTANFIILNMGEKPTTGYSITVDSVKETAEKIIVTVKETAPEEGMMSATLITNPYTIVKINSKKTIEIK